MGDILCFDAKADGFVGDSSGFGLPLSGHIDRFLVAPVASWSADSVNRPNQQPGSVVPPSAAVASVIPRHSIGASVPLLPENG
jgi:hypothetical protein